MKEEFAYIAQIKVSDKEEILLKSLEAENKKRDRSIIDINNKDSLLVVDIKAKDANALRAALNSITQLLSVNEKIRRIK